MEPYTRPAREKAGQKYGSAFRLHHTGQLLYGDDSVRTLQEPLAGFSGALVLVVLPKNGIMGNFICTRGNHQGTLLKTRHFQAVRDYFRIAGDSPGTQKSSSTTFDSRLAV